MKFTQKGLHALKIYRKIEISQKTNSGQPNRDFMAFFMPKNRKPLANPTISHYSQGNTIISQVLSLVRYDGATLQNKPLGEYAGRLLFVPRVNPITSYLLAIFSTQKQIGAYP